MTLLMDKNDRKKGKDNSKIMTLKPIFTKNFSIYHVKSTFLFLQPVQFNDDIINLNKGFQTQINENN